MKRKTKIPNVIVQVKRSIDRGEYIYTGHAQKRLQEREVTRQEIKQVFKNAHHEKNKDKFDMIFNEWNYSIKGKTVDSRKLRIIVSFDENEMLIITVIDLNK